MSKRAHVAKVARHRLWSVLLQIGSVGSLSPPRLAGMGGKPDAQQHLAGRRGMSFAPDGLAALQGILGPDGSKTGCGATAPRPASFSAFSNLQHRRGAVSPAPRAETSGPAPKQKLPRRRLLRARQRVPTAGGIVRSERQKGGPCNTPLYKYECAGDRKWT